MEQQAVFQHPRFVRVTQFAKRAASQMFVSAEALVAARADSPTRFADPVREIRFVPFRRHERFVEQADALGDLVSRRYLRSIPADPITRSISTWVVLAPADPQKGGVYDVKSGAKGTGRDGSPYEQW